MKINKKTIYNILKLILLLPLIISCVSFTQTGKIYPPLSETEVVTVFLTDKPKEYIEIGIAEYNATGTLTYAVSKAKKKAREVGGNCLILHSSDKITDIHGDGDDISSVTTNQYLFIIARIQTEE